MEIRRTVLLIILFGLLFILLSWLLSYSNSDRVLKSASAMLGALFFIWVIVFGFIQYKYREIIVKFAKGIISGRKLRFILFAIVLMLIEEAIAVSITNFAPFFGSNIGDAYLTASGSYLDVIFFHSVIVTIPMFIVLALLVKKLSISASHVFLLFGITGWITEIIFGGIVNIFMVGIWIPIYGLMVYLPALSIEKKGAKSRPSVLEYTGIIILPYLVSIPVAYLILLSGHPVIHF